MTERVFQAIDLDRTLFDTWAMVDNLGEVLEAFDPELRAEMDIESARCLEAKESFQIFDFLKVRLGNRFVAFTTELKRHIGQDELLMPGAKERLRFANSRPNWSGGIVTYGQPDGQRLKLELAGLTAYPHLVTDAAEKSRMIASWQQADGSFTLPRAFGGKTVDIVTLDDDKLNAFEAMPENSYGNWVIGDQRPERALPASLENRVAAVPNLLAAVSRLEKVLNA